MTNSNASNGPGITATDVVAGAVAYGGHRAASGAFGAVVTGEVGAAMRPLGALLDREWTLARSRPRAYRRRFAGLVLLSLGLACLGLAMFDNGANVQLEKVAALAGAILVLVSRFLTPVKALGDGGAVEPAVIVARIPLGQRGCSRVTACENQVVFYTLVGRPSMAVS